MDQPLIDLYHRHVGMGFDRQLRLADFLARKAAGQPWDYDTATAVLTIGPKVAFEAHILGSHAHNNDSWLWAWSNEHIHLSLTNRALGDTVRAIGHRVGVPALSMVGMPLEPLLGPDLVAHAVHVLGVVLVEELGYDGYYLAPYEGGEGLLLVRDDRLKVTEKRPLVRVLTVFPQVLATYPVFDHKAALRSYADAHGLTVTDEPTGLRLTSGKDYLTATFDHDGRLTKLDGTVSPEKPAAKKKPVAKKKPAKKPVVKKVVKKAPAKKAGVAAKKVAKGTAAKVVKKATRPPAAKTVKKAAKKPGKKR